ncbi:MAG TPA: MerR family transcriptional regulator [Actinocrinis sp.]|nr:MerR family transcriptional regulator [Actinocrinis sp.]
MVEVTYSVGEVSARTGFSIDTLRYYERLGLIEPVERTVGGKRRYRECDIEWLDFVSCLRLTGMPVNGMRHFAQLCRTGDGTIRERIELLSEHGRQVEAELATLRDRLTAIQGKIGYYEGVLALEDADAQSVATS